MISYIEKTLDISKLKLGQEYYYNSLVFCVIDAIYSINSVYTSTKNTVNRFCKKNGLQIYRPYGSLPDDCQNEYTIEDFIEFINGKSPEYLANVVFENKQRTSAKNGILKAEAVCEFAKILNEYSIFKFSDIHRLYDYGEIENRIKSIKGQRSGLSLTYFYMLSGNDNYVKADRHILNFIFEATGQNVSKQQAEALLTDCVLILKGKYPGITCRLLDYSIWSYMSSRK